MRTFILFFLTCLFFAGNIFKQNLQAYIYPLLFCVTLRFFWFLFMPLHFLIWREGEITLSRICFICSKLHMDFVCTVFYKTALWKPVCRMPFPSLATSPNFLSDLFTKTFCFSNSTSLIQSHCCVCLFMLSVGGALLRSCLVSLFSRLIIS